MVYSMSAQESTVNSNILPATVKSLSGKDPEWATAVLRIYGHSGQRVIAFCVEGKYDTRMYYIRTECVDSLMM